MTPKEFLENYCWEIEWGLQARLADLAARQKWAYAQFDEELREAHNGLVLATREALEHFYALKEAH
jgi:predicted transcriptional regulator